jgi:hypothetical protein
MYELHNGALMTPDGVARLSQIVKAKSSMHVTATYLFEQRLMSTVFSM